MTETKTFIGTKGMVLVSLQYMENYSWYLGSGAEPYWKYKGGVDVIVPADELNTFLSDSRYVYDNNHSRQYVLGYDVLSEDLEFEIPDYLDESEVEDYISCMAPEIWKGVENV